MLRDLFPSLKDGPMEPIFAPWKALREQGPPHILSPSEDGPLSALPSAWLNSQLPQHEQDGRSNPQLRPYLPAIGSTMTLNEHSQCSLKPHDRFFASSVSSLTILRSLSFLQLCPGSR